MEFEHTKQENRRVDPRAQLSEMVQFEQIEQKEFGGSIGFDISESGLRMRFNDYVPVGTELSLKITLPDRQVVECKGIVVWIKKEPYNDSYQIGIQFTEIENVVDSKEKIHHYIESFQS